ncbi:SLC7A3 [Acanthosepion pharaonis]|uniref:SLC7A3 n=1 Tax=Acanthosepion pharaonis TaxID=158019 RepID=A0A812CIF4_ACAPH|nr:SLC7A3 [Sepia pharaonis]
MGLLFHFSKLFRKKSLKYEDLGKTKLARVLTLLDLTLLGVGSTLGAGAYVLSGKVASQTAGPAIVVSFFVAAVVSVLAGLCYAEFGARVPRTGSAYVYSYITIGEFVAFIIGWNLILEYAIGTASVARAWSANFDSLVQFKISHTLNSTLPMNVPNLAEYPDFFALGLTLLLTALLIIGVKQSSTFNSVFTVINLLVLSYFIICGFFKADAKNWSIDKKDIPPGVDGGNGGFMPFGISGMLSGAATCFYGFVGFDCIATTGEEAKNPEKSIPISIIVSLFIVFIFYFGVSAVLTMMSPYYSLDSEAPLPKVFELAGWPVAKYVIAVGAVLIGAIFPLPRVVYAMAEDRLIFGFLANVSDKLKTPINATIVTGILSGMTALLFDLTELVNMMSIGTLLAYAFVAKCVVILRYKVKAFDTEMIVNESNQGPEMNSDSHSEPFTFKELFRPFTNMPSKRTEQIVIVCSLLLSLCTIILNVLLIYKEKDLNKFGWVTCLLAIFCIIILGLGIIIWCQPQNPDELPFMVPLVPLFPEVSAAINIYLMLKLPNSTWVRFAVWMGLGFFLYFGYGFWHSMARKDNTTSKYLPISEEDDPEDTS